VMTAAQRARKIGSGATLTVDRDRDKNPVVALREIAGETIDLPAIKEELVRGHQRMVVYEEDNDTIDLMDGEQEWATIAARDADMYEDIDDEDEDEEGDEEPSLNDLAGNPAEE
jgi:DNA-directed RNA polymerase subunit omega